MSRAYAIGVFDMFHVGHLRFLQKAATFGDLTVGIQDDRWVEKCKGSAPTIPLSQRVELIAGLSCVKEVISYGSSDQTAVLDYVLPNVLCVGPEYGNTPEQKNTLATCKKRNITVQVIPRTTGVSSSLIKDHVSSFWKERFLYNEPTTLTLSNPTTEFEIEAILPFIVSSYSIGDFGCGDGRLAFSLAQWCRRYDCYEAQRLAVEKIRARAITEGRSNIFAYTASLPEHFPTNQYDISILSGILPCLSWEDQDVLLQKTFAATRKNVVIRSSFAMGKPIEVVNQYSPELEATYTAFYRTLQDLLEQVPSNWRKVKDQVLSTHHADTYLNLLVFTHV